MTPRVEAILEMRLSKSSGKDWVFPAGTKSGHIEPSSLKKQHARAIEEATAILRKQTQCFSETCRLVIFKLVHTAPLGSSLVSHGDCSGQNGGDDILISRATAEITFQLMAHGLLVGVRVTHLVRPKTRQPKLSSFE